MGSYENLIMRVIGLIVVVLTTYTVIKIFNKIVKSRFMDNDSTVVSFVASAIRFVIYAISLGIFAILIGVPVTMVTGIVTGIIFGVSISLKSVYSTIASAIIITVSKPISIGDYVEVSGSKGIVESFDFFNVKLKKDCGAEIIIPNNTFVNNIVVINR